MLYEFALDSAPNTLAENNQFFLPVLNGQITLPSNEFVVGIYVVNKKMPLNKVYLSV